MENKLDKRHIQLPSNAGLSELTPQDQLVYLGIRSFMNRDTLEAFPSQDSVAERIGCCRNTVRKCLKNLIDKNYISVRKQGKKIVYKFNRLKQFEPFSYEFLENKDLSFSEKSLLAASQTFMKDKESGIGKISYSKKELSEMINMPYSTLTKITRNLENKEIISLVKAANSPQEMQFNFQKYGQQIVKVLVNHDRTLSLHKQVLLNHEEILSDQESILKDHENTLLNQNEKLQSLLERIEALENENKRLKNANQDIYI